MKVHLLKLSLVLISVLCLMGADGCHPVDLYKNRYLDKMAAAGYIKKTVVLGPDTVTYWDNHAQKPPLLLAHGFGGGGTWSWTKQFLELGKHFRVISADFLWFHDSHSTKRDFSLKHQAEMLAALIKHVGINKTHIMGTSYGGLVAYQLAMLEPGLLDQIIIAASPGPDYNTQDYEAMCKRLGIKHLGELLLVETTDDFEFLMDSIYYKGRWMPHWAQTRLVETHYTKFHPERVQLLDEVINQRAELVQASAPLQHDVLLIYGEFDLLFPVSLGQRYKNYLGANASLKVVEDTRHVAQMERPDIFNKMVLEFLKP